LHTPPKKAVRTRVLGEVCVTLTDSILATGEQPFSSKRRRIERVEDLEMPSTEQSTPIEPLMEKCGVCLDFILNKASINNCRHIFCSECIQLWSKVTNTCPLCKARFSEIITTDFVSQEFLNIYVPDKNQSVEVDTSIDDLFVLEEGEEGESVDSDQDEDWKPEEKRLEDIVDLPLEIVKQNVPPPSISELMQDLTRIVREIRSEKSKEYLCQEQGCGKCFKRKGDFTRHLLSHSDVRPFACNTCEKKFKLKGDLTKHEFSHKLVKEFICNVEGCGKRFTLPGNLARHRKTVHDAVKAFTCETCSKSFFQSGDLKRHMRIHNNERNFVCKDCGKAFIQKAHLNAHTKTHTR
jgi:hypothetical protein